MNNCFIKFFIFLLLFSNGYVAFSKNVNVLIVTAIDSEFEQINKLMSNKEEIVLKEYGLNKKILKGKLSNRNVMVIICGVGKVNAGVWTSYILSKYNISHVINSGVAGGVVSAKYKDIKVGDVVVSSEVAYHDVDLTKFGYKVGQLKGLPQKFIANKNLIKNAIEAVKSKVGGSNAYSGLIVSGDQFIDPTYINKIIGNFKDVIAVEMEGAAIGHVSHMFNIPFIVIRSISDIVNKEGNEVEYSKFSKIAAFNSAKVVQEILRKL
ncbi:5'-methylthioadenosine/adenosylhomocysteine nucleosidase [Borreliella americana]|uniref:5'-methylthioadenosine/adenosylhomocysteine nucleosidase n=1 Tax=Borreliella americana TaxID=478807 RepID=UPI001E483A36|nr:5'-methylthioadenosine/adenosylhomocysteine nucleosidase [Borreliella americana]MCD2332337.1 5'-methylthioadenosine/adenosylhomocysteine nucleosidase [Borreliella americana]MCD2349578.1 5'-methylthioadenosine/adenosylhomocysteine nucleosidase [Borreliella americana]MCD2382612.1 5'-methylthioadenosine/adenosylhomocysteine nucleosidase [Borreliella americana]